MLKKQKPKKQKEFRTVTYKLPIEFEKEFLKTLESKGFDTISKGIKYAIEITYNIKLEY